MCNGGSVATARGIPEHPMRPTVRSTPGRRQGKPRTKIRSCENPRMRVCSPTSPGCAPTVARSSQNNFSRVSGEGGFLRVRGLTTDIRGCAKSRCQVSQRAQPRGAISAFVGTSFAHAVGREPRGCTVRPVGAYCQWRKIPPRELSSSVAAQLPLHVLVDIHLISRLRLMLSFLQPNESWS